MLDRRDGTANAAPISAAQIESLRCILVHDEGRVANYDGEADSGAATFIP